MLKLGDINLDVPFYQAPLSGYTDRAMRVLAHEYGAPLTYTGIILAKIVLHKKVKYDFQEYNDTYAAS